MLLNAYYSQNYASINVSRPSNPPSINPGYRPAESHAFGSNLMHFLLRSHSTETADLERSGCGGWGKPHSKMQGNVRKYEC